MAARVMLDVVKWRWRQAANTSTCRALRRLRWGERVTATGKGRGESWALSEGVRRSMRSNKGRDTKPELRIRSAVHALGMRYYVNTRPLPNFRRTADLVFTRARIAVFVDGCFWHGCPEHHSVAKTNANYWARKVRENRLRDADTDRVLSEAGWVVVRIWEHEPVESAAKRIYESWVEATGRHGRSFRLGSVGPADSKSGTDAAAT